VKGGRREHPHRWFAKPRMPVIRSRLLQVRVDVAARQPIRLLCANAGHRPAARKRRLGPPPPDLKLSERQLPLWASRQYLPLAPLPKPAVPNGKFGGHYASHRKSAECALSKPWTPGRAASASSLRPPVGVEPEIGREHQSIQAGGFGSKVRVGPRPTVCRWASTELTSDSDVLSDLKAESGASEMGVEAQRRSASDRRLRLRLS
jgi:hypothetical protein